MVLKSYTGFSDQCLIEHLNGNIHYQLFCGIMIDPSAPITNFKIVSAIRSELSQKMVIEDLQEVLAQAWRPLLCDKRIACPYLRWRSNPSTTCLTRSQVEVAFVIFTFQYFTFHFYMYKETKGFCRKKSAMEGILLLLYYREGVKIAP